ncbi:LOW QUALITY PROTEIN: uncharacterized protein O9250_007719 [Rhynochetos jubatus]
MACGRRSGGSKRQVILFILCVCVCQSGAETLRYSLAEEMERDSFVANIARDLGFSPSQLAARKARVVSEGNEQLFRLSQNTGVLTVTESLDREAICPQSDTCTLFFKIFFENPLQLIRGEVEVRDVNDNPPVFPEKEMVLEILETTSPGSRFPLESAQDKDVGSNGLQNYSLGSNSHFSLALGTGKDGVKYAELVLQRQLDREEQRELNLLLTATDGGSPPRSGTAQVRIVVLDANDNTPVFSREVYEVRLAENSPPEQSVLRVTAADPDEGSYGKVRYAFTQTSERSRQLFKLNPATGEIRISGNLDFEEAKNHEMVVRATDGGGLSAHCKVQVEVLDVNDNAPEIALTSLTTSIPEDAPLRTVVALFSVRDRDSGDNGRTECSIDRNLPFSLTPTFDNYYELRTNAALDRERTAQYNITITAVDRGTTRLSSRESVFVKISDVNDNSPQFTQEVYIMSVTENNSPMLRIGSVNATDADAGTNARVSYALVRQEGKKQPDVSVSSETGDVYILRSLDYEKVHAFEVAVRATDGGSPALSTQAVLRLVVRDENDNAPVVLHPSPDSSAAAGELVPRWARAGYLVAKVVAVDADAGQNAWLSYELAKATEPGLFRVGLHSGEVRTARAVAERDAPRQRLVVLVRDRGQPPRSATTTLGIALVDGFSDAHLQVSEEAPAAEPDGPLTLYLIACLAGVSALFLATAVAAVVLKVRRARRGEAETLPTFPTAATDSNAGSLSRSYVYDVCFTTGTVNSEFRFLRPLLPCFPAGLPPGPGEQWSSMRSQEAANLGEGGDWAAQGSAPLSEDTGPRPAEAACTANGGMELNVSSHQNPWLTHEEGKRQACLPSPVASSQGKEDEEANQPPKKYQRDLMYDSETATPFKCYTENRKQLFKITFSYITFLTYKIDVQVSEGGGLFVHCKLEMEDANDSGSEVTVTSTISEAARPNTVVALFFVRERDSENNGRMSCELPAEQPFIITSLTSNGYALLPLRRLLAASPAGEGDSVPPASASTPRRRGKRVVLVSPPCFAKGNTGWPLGAERARRPAGSGQRGKTRGTCRRCPCARTEAAAPRDSGRSSAALPAAGRRVALPAKTAPSGCERGAAEPSPAQQGKASRPGGTAQRERRAVTSSEFPLPSATGQRRPRSVPTAELREGDRPPARRRFPRRTAPAIRETEAVRRPDMAIARQVLCLCAFLSLPHARSEPIRYSVAEEAESGSVVANVAEDAGLAPAQLSARRARLASEDGRQHFRLDRGTGRLVVAERLDREELCGRSGTCTLPLELVLANPLQFFRVEVAVEDINDHSPVFPEEQVTLKIPERSDPGSRFPLEGARDLDVGSNSIQAYSIAPENDYFSVSLGNQTEDDKYVELVLGKPLDREEQAEVDFSLIAVDGGSPPRSGTTQIHIVVLDVNDNAPIFTQKVYVAQVLENTQEGSVVLTVVATDRDVGVNGDISYQFSQVMDKSLSAFVIDPMSGEIKIRKPLDFEAAEKYELSVRATDGGGLSAICKVLVEVVDVNDNAPELVVSSFSSRLPENALPGTVVALFAVRDRDAGANGKVSCALEDQLSFSLRPAYKNYYELVTVSMLDREETARYILSVTAADAGSPPLTTTQTFTVDISDVNDNAPVFNQTSYTMYVRENNVPTALIGAVTAVDADVGPNAKVTYSLALAHPTEQPPCSCISVNSANGHVFVLRPLDYEKVRQIEVLVRASDAGSPPLSANITVRLVVVDENDNAPLVLHPAQDGSPPSSELVPMSAEAGYLVTKVVAVDADSGQNSWLSYHLLRATDPGLFVVGAQSGEVRLRRAVTERDAVKQKLVVLVRDNGRPPLSATAALSALLLNDLSEVRLPHSSLATEDEGSSLTTYLIISLVFVSLLFLASVSAFITHKVCKRNKQKDGHVLYGSSNLQSSLADAVGVGTLPPGYCYEVSLTMGSGNSEFKFLKPILPSLPPQHCSTGGGTGYDQDFPPAPVTTQAMAPEDPGTVSAEQFNSLSFN